MGTKRAAMADCHGTLADWPAVVTQSQGQTLLREVAALQSRLDQERTQRSFVQTAIRDSKDEVAQRLQAQARFHPLHSCRSCRQVPECLPRLSLRIQLRAISLCVSQM